MRSPKRTWIAGTTQPIPEYLTGIRWPDGIVECRFRLLHPAGSLVAEDGQQGLVLTATEVACTTCSDACIG